MAIVIEHQLTYLYDLGRDIGFIDSHDTIDFIVKAILESALMDKSECANIIKHNTIVDTYIEDSTCKHLYPNAFAQYDTVIHEIMEIFSITELQSQILVEAIDEQIVLPIVNKINDNELKYHIFNIEIKNGKVLSLINLGNVYSIRYNEWEKIMNDIGH